MSEFQEVVCQQVALQLKIRGKVGLVLYDASYCGILGHTFMQLVGDFRDVNFSSHRSIQSIFLHIHSILFLTSVIEGSFAQFDSSFFSERYIFWCELTVGCF